MTSPDLRVLRVCRDRKALRGCRDRKVLRVLKESQVKKAPKAFKGQKVLRVLRESKGPKVRKVQKDLPELAFLSTSFSTQRIMEPFMTAVRSGMSRSKVEATSPPLRVVDSQEQRLDSTSTSLELAVSSTDRSSRRSLPFSQTTR